jgi:hypothetical protein
MDMLREYTFSLEYETRVYLLSVLLGAAIGVLYDVFRALRIVFPHKNIAVAAEDVVFSFLSCSAAYVFATAFTGKLRVFTLVGMAGGFVLEHFSVGNLAMFLLSKAVKTLKGWVLMPLKKFIHKIGQKIKASFVKSHINLLKNKKNLQSP